MIRKIKKEVGCSFKENIQYMDQTLPVEKSFDIIRREMEIGGKESVFYYIDGFIKDEAMLKIMDSFLSITAEDLPQDAETFSKQKIPYVEVDVLKCFDDILRNVLSGTAVFFVDGYDAALCMDCRSYPARSVDEPDKDKSLRGSRDGFVETIVFNTALMRRRIRDPHLIMEMTEAGQSSRTDIAVCYMSDRVDEELLNNIKSRIEKQARIVYRSVNKGVEIPGLVTDILKEHLEGQSVVNIDLHSSEDLTNVISAAIRNIVVGLCVAALLIASSVICTTDMTPKILGIPALGFAGYAFAMVVSIFLTVRYLWSKRKKRK